MGLDMYLHAKKYVEKIDWNKLRDLDLFSPPETAVLIRVWLDVSLPAPID